MLGQPFMPWQRRAAGVALEVDDHGRFSYPLVLVTVPRQSGKTAFVFAAQLYRALSTAGGRVWYTAQNGIKSREQTIEFIDRVQTSPLSRFVSCKRGAGDTRIDVPASAARIKAHPPTADSLHGNQSDLNVIDEAWWFDEQTAAALMAAITPTQLTRGNPQTWIVSTEGTAESTWFHGLVDEARAGAPGVCLIDYGIGPDVAADDIDAIAAAHPAVGHTCSVDAIRDARASLSDGEFARAYGNRRTTARERVIPLDAYQAVQDTAPIPEDAPLAVAGAVDIDRTETAIVAAGLVDDTPVVEVIEVRPGVDWGAARLAEVGARWTDGRVIVDRHGPSATLADGAEQAGATVEAPTLRDITVACADLHDRITAPSRTHTVRIRPHPKLDAAVDVAARRRVGDGSWLWHRRASAASIAALEAATLAVHGLTHRPAPAAAPRVYVP